MEDDIKNWVSPMMVKELLKVKKRVLTKDRDWVCVYDGEEGVGKSVLAMQHAKVLDPDFCLDNVVFTSDDFISRIKDPNIKKGTAIVLDEAFSSANSRSSLTEVNKSMIAVATEMRQKNLFILMVLPSFFDLDRYFAIWRCRALFHLYFTPDEDRRYILFPKDQKKLLYLYGKKFYNYSKPHSSFPPFNFPNHYVVDEEAYRLKKSKAFSKRKVTARARIWYTQRNAYLKYIYEKLKVKQKDLGQIPALYGSIGLTQQSIGAILEETEDITPQNS